MTATGDEQRRQQVEKIMGTAPRLGDSVEARCDRVMSVLRELEDELDAGTANRHSVRLMHRVVYALASDVNVPEATALELARRYAAIEARLLR